jgi:hypothetical protein
MRPGAQFKIHTPSSAMDAMANAEDILLFEIIGRWQILSVSAGRARGRLFQLGFPLVEFGNAIQKIG